jgi:hypothetical protein
MGDVNAMRLVDEGSNYGNAQAIWLKRSDHLNTQVAMHISIANA